MCNILQKSKANNTLVTTSAALQDHITRSLLCTDASPADPFWRHLRKTSRDPKARERVEENQEDREYVLDPALPPLTLGKTNTGGYFPV